MNQLSSITPLEIILIGSAAVGVFLFFRACWRNIKRSRQHLSVALLTLMMSFTAQTAWATVRTVTYTISYNSNTRYWLDGSDGSHYNIGTSLGMAKTYTMPMGDVTITMTSADNRCGIGNYYGSDIAGFDRHDYTFKFSSTYYIVGVKIKDVVMNTELSVDNETKTCTVNWDHSTYRDAQQFEVTLSDSPAYRISYVLNGSTNAATNPEWYEQGTGVASLAAPTGKDDYLFEGWYDNANFEGSPINSIAANATGAITLYAKWTQFRFAINYVLDHGTTTTVNPSTYETGVGVASLADPTRTGYDFGGWYDNDSFNGSPITSIPANSAGDKTLYAKWTAHRYNISYEPNEGTMPSKYTTSYTVRTVTFNLPTPSREGYYFRGWYTDEDFASDKYTQIKYGTHQDFAFYAKWEKYAENGDGSRWNPYKINNETDLRILATLVNGGDRRAGLYYQQTADIEIKEGDWTPIGTGGVYFSGNYDGGGYTISGITIDSSSKYQGLFGKVTGTNDQHRGFIQNIVLAVSNIHGAAYTGGIVGWLNCGHVLNCHVRNSVTVTGTSGKMGVGGVVGYFFGGTVTNCTSMASVSTGSKVGGVIGYMKNMLSDETAAATNCFSYNKAPIGELDSGTTTNVECVHKVRNTDGNVILPDAVDATDGFYYDGIGYYKQGVSIPLTVTPAPVGYDIEVKQDKNIISPDENGDYFYTVPDENKTFTISATSHLSPLLGYIDTNTPDGSADNPYIINSTDGWNLMSDCLQDNTTWNGFSGKTFKLDADIEVTRMAGTSGHDFKGTFNGAGHKLTVDYSATENYTAPFRYVEDGAKIKNLHVDGTITTDYKYATGLVGSQFGEVSISNCRSSVTIQSSKKGDGTHAGLVALKGSSANLTIDGCVFDGKIVSTGTDVTTDCSGFVGYCSNNGSLTIRNSIYAPQTDAKAVSTGATFARNWSDTPTNCYYTQTLGNAQGKLAYVLPDAPELLGEGTGEGIVKTYENYGLGFDKKYYLATIPLSETEGVSYLTDYLQGKEVPVEFNREFSAGKASTICLPFAMDNVSGGKVYSFAGITYDEKDGWVATMSEAEKDGNNVTSTKANTPYVFMPDADGEVTFSGTTDEIPAAYDAEKLSTTSGEWTFCGTYQVLKYGTAPMQGPVYGFASTDKEVDGVNVSAGEFVKAKAGAGVKPMRCYLIYGNVSAGTRAADELPQSITVRFLSSTGGTTTIGTLDTETGEIDFGGWYTLSGRKLDTKPTQKGLYIHNGKKIVIK